MRIDWLKVKNFKGFAEREFHFPRREDAPPETTGSFHVLIGDNGSGKTSVLDALAVAMGVWLTDPPDTSLMHSKRSILPAEIRLEPRLAGDRWQFFECKPANVIARGAVHGHEDIEWKREIRDGGRKTTKVGIKHVLQIIARAYADDRAGRRSVLPVIAYYGAGRAWLPSNERVDRSKSHDGPARRWDAFYDCLNERIRLVDINRWFQREQLAAGGRRGGMRPGFAAVELAVLQAVSGATGVFYDADRSQIALTVAGAPQPLGNLSAGQRSMLALVADIAIKCVTQNAHLLPPDVLGPEDDPLPRVLRQTPGVVLIDELDVHLHPAWQRRVAADLMRVFPNIQFITTTHSPQIIGELPREAITKLTGSEGEPTGVPGAFGMDSNWILEHVQDGAPRTPSVQRRLDELAEAIGREDFSSARAAAQELESELGDFPELAEKRALLDRLEMLLGDAANR